MWVHIPRLTKLFYLDFIQVQIQINEMKCDLKFYSWQRFHLACLIALLEDMLWRYLMISGYPQYRIWMWSRNIPFFLVQSSLIIKWAEKYHQTESCNAFNKNPQLFYSLYFIKQLDLNQNKKWLSGMGFELTTLFKKHKCRQQLFAKSFTKVSQSHLGSANPYLSPVS